MLSWPFQSRPPREPWKSGGTHRSCRGWPPVDATGSAAVRHTRLRHLSNRAEFIRNRVRTEVQNTELVTATKFFVPPGS